MERRAVICSPLLLLGAYLFRTLTLVAPLPLFPDRDSFQVQTTTPKLIFRHSGLHVLYVAPASSVLAWPLQDFEIPWAKRPGSTWRLAFWQRASHMESIERLRYSVHLGTMTVRQALQKIIDEKEKAESAAYKDPVSS